MGARKTRMPSRVQKTADEEKRRPQGKRGAAGVCAYANLRLCFLRWKERVISRSPTAPLRSSGSLHPFSPSACGEEQVRPGKNGNRRRGLMQSLPPLEHASFIVECASLTVGGGAAVKRSTPKTERTQSFHIRIQVSGEDDERDLALGITVCIVVADLYARRFVLCLPPFAH